MVKRMLIDATHAEESRVVVIHGNRLEEYDVETSTKKQIKGNIYLAKVTRVEPSLQAAFVDYGGNRHGFLAFSEIHSDYYQIPVADREALAQQSNTQVKDAEIVEDNIGDTEDSPKKTRSLRVPARAANRAPRARMKHPTRQRQKTPTPPHRQMPLPRQMPQPTMPVQARKKKPSRVAVARAIVARKAMMSKHLATTQKHPLTATTTTVRTVTIPRQVATLPCLRKSPSLKLMSMTRPTK